MVLSQAGSLRRQRAHLHQRVLSPQRRALSFLRMPYAGCEDVRLALKAVATSLVRKGMAKNIQVHCRLR